MRYIIANNLKLKDIKGIVNKKFYDSLIEKRRFRTSEVYAKNNLQD